MNVAGKTLYRTENRIFAELLRDVRVRSGLTQMQIVEALEMTQTFASEAERGIRRLDIVQIRDWCAATGTTLPALIREFEKRLNDPEFAEPRETDGRKKGARPR
jgi:transcriptional regulator with XRE-family HTH domain